MLARTTLKNAKKAIFLLECIPSKGDAPEHYIREFSKTPAFDKINYKTVVTSEFTDAPFEPNDPDVEIIVANFVDLGKETEALLKNYPSVKWVQCLTVGYYPYLTKTMLAHQCVLTNGKGGSSMSLAEGVIYEMLKFCRREEHYRKMKELHQYTPVVSLKLSKMTLGKILDSLNFLLASIKCVIKKLLLIQNFNFFHFFEKF